MNQKLRTVAFIIIPLTVVGFVIGVTVGNYLQTGKAFGQVQTATTNQPTTKYNIILVEYSETCRKLLSIKDTSNCPTLDQLAPFDTTKQTAAGHFIKDKKGHIIARSKPNITNYWQFYDTSPDRIVCVDCPFDFANTDLAPIIIIEPKDSNNPYRYVNKDYNYTTTINDISSSTLLVNYGRYVSSDCLQANEPFDPKILADTIYYINSGCTKTSYNNQTTIKLVTPFTDITKSRQWKDDQWLKAELKINLGNCISNPKCPKTKDPNSNW